MKKGEVIIVTQKEDGGWWEGTSRETGKTGWFPSNYVSEIKDVTPTSDSGISSSHVFTNFQSKKIVHETCFIFFFSIR